tara:strand:- start:1667 stop:2617 length:951 start_codon:yes stop_codon:yes gene_type:complete
MKDYALIRYTGGAGGERITSIIAHYLNKNTIDIKNSYNRIKFTDLFHNSFTTEAPYDRNVIIKCNLPSTSPPSDPRHGMVNDWINCDSADVSRVVQYYKNKKQKIGDVVGKSHFVFNENLDYSIAFEGFKILDIRPAAGKDWVTTALQWYKAACNIVTERNPNWQSVVSSDEFRSIEEHLDTYGWIPEYWLWGWGSISWDEFLEKDCHNLKEHRIPLKYDNAADMVLEACSVTTDVDLKWTTDLCKFIDIPELIPDHYVTLTNWVNGNLQILDQFGLADKINEEMTVDEQCRLLKSSFNSTIYDDIMYKKYNVRRN